MTSSAAKEVLLLASLQSLAARKERHLVAGDLNRGFLQNRPLPLSSGLDTQCNANRASGDQQTWIESMRRRRSSAEDGRHTPFEEARLVAKRLLRKLLPSFPPSAFSSLLTVSSCLRV